MATLKALKLSLFSRKPSVLSPGSVPGPKQEGTDFGEMTPTGGSNTRENQNDGILPMVHMYVCIYIYISLYLSLHEFQQFIIC